MPKLKFVSKIVPSDIEILTEFKNHSSNRKERVRAESLLLSNDGFSINQIVDIVKYDRDTISGWIDKFNLRGVASITDEFRPGRPPKFDENGKLLTLLAVSESPTSIKTALAQIISETGVNVSIYTVKRILKEYGLSWKRTRKSLDSRKDEVAFDKSKKEINELLEDFKKKK